MAAKLGPDVVAAIHACVDAGTTGAPAILRALWAAGMSAGIYSISNHVKKYKTEKNLPAPPKPVAVAAAPTVGETADKATERKFTEEDDKAELQFMTRREIRTLEDAIVYAEVDTTVWRVTKWECTSWEVVAKHEALTNDDQGKTWKLRTPKWHHLWRVWMRLERIISKPLHDAIESVFARYREKAPVYKPAKHLGGELLLHFDLFDVHFGKLAWRGETGQDYDLKIAEAVFANAVTDLIEEATGRRVDKIILPFGNDYTHTDSGKNATTLGTLVDTDGRRDKIYEVALMAIIRAVEQLRQIAPVEIIRVPGNHDEDTSLGMSWALKTRFWNAPDVTVDVSPGPRKYRLYGKTLFGYQHGNWLSDAMVKELPAQMLQEAPREWQGVAEFHEWIIGHHHRERKFTTKDIDTKIGTVTRYIHSLSATDAWHNRMGFIGARRAAEVYRHHREAGYLGNALALARV